MDVCIPNIGPRQRLMRLSSGIMLLAVSGVLAVGAAAAGVARPWRLALFLPLWVAALAIVQARSSTCVALAATGSRNMDGGAERIVDIAELRQVKLQARRVYLRAFVMAAIFTAAAAILP